MMKKYISLLKLVRSWFGADCKYRTCHYRHALVHYGLSLAIEMLKELSDGVDSREYDDIIKGLKWCEMERCGSLQEQNAGRLEEGNNDDDD